MAQDRSTRRLFAPAEAMVAIAPVEVAVPFVVPAPVPTTMDVLVTVAGRQTPGLLVLQPPAQQPSRAVSVAVVEL
jgi:hypothetical protein